MWVTGFEAAHLASDQPETWSAALRAYDLQHAQKVTSTGGSAGRTQGL